jgi:quinolinate synthase
MQLKKRVPEASVVVHPESPASVIDLADFVGSTSEMIKYVIQSDSKKIIVGTDNGLIHMMKKKAPEKIYLEAPTAGNGASCKSCAHCPWMEMNDLRDIFTVLITGNNEIQVESKTASLARKSIQRMLDFQLN